MRVTAKMYYSSGLEYLVKGYYLNNQHNHINYFFKNTDDNYGFNKQGTIIFARQYTISPLLVQYNNKQQYQEPYPQHHSFAPEIFLNPSRQKSKVIGDSNEIKGIAEEAFELMMNKKLPESISINVLPLEEFKALHSCFGIWSSGILGFSINNKNKKQVFVRENNLDALMLVMGHEIGHVLTGTLPNKHDEEAKAFAFSIEWARTIRQHNIANLGLSIKEDIEFQPARNGLHDVAFGFVDFMLRKGRRAMELHTDLIKKYVSVFGRIY